MQFLKTIILWVPTLLKGHMMENVFEEKSIFNRGGYEPVSVGKRLREIRTSFGYSIKYLAEKSGLAVNTLSLIENEKTSPSVNTLDQLAQALGIPLNYFFEPIKTEPQIIMTQSGHRRTMHYKDMLVEDCGLELEGQPIQPLLVTLPSSMKVGSAPRLHTGHEFVYCLSGRVDYFVDDKKYSLGVGDSLVMQASVPHRWINPYEEPAVYLLVMVPGDPGDLDGEIHFQDSQEIDG